MKDQTVVAHGCRNTIKLLYVAWKGKWLRLMAPCPPRQLSEHIDEPNAVS